MTSERPTDEVDDSSFDRREYLLGLAGVAGAGALAGCGGDSGNGNGGNGNGNGNGGNGNGGNGNGNGGNGGGDLGELEIIHWWTSGSEKAALDALKEVYRNQNPSASIKDNPAPGGAGSAFDTKIKNRILNEDPPGTFQIWPGKAMTPFVEGDALASIGDVWTDGMKDNYLEGVQNAARFDGEFKAVPVNIHRLNNLFFNMNVLDDAGVDPEALQSVSDVVDAMEAVESNTDAVGMAQAQKVWTTLQMWETILIAESGTDTFMDIVNGNPGDNRDAIETSLELVDATREYWNEDASSISWDQGAGKVINGEAAFIHQGDWAAGEFLGAEDFTFDEDWGNMAFPGSSGVYSLVMDSFVKPEPNPSPDATDAWLQACGSVEGQIAFNKEKGSIPPRSDVSTDEFGPFLTSQIDDFQASDDQPPTIAHGAALSPTKKTDMEEAFSTFIESWDAGSTADEVVNVL